VKTEFLSRRNLSQTGKSWQEKERNKEPAEFDFWLLNKKKDFPNGLYEREKGEKRLKGVVVSVVRYV
jgi:hypothetical protein